MTNKKLPQRKDWKEIFLANDLYIRIYRMNENILHLRSYEYGKDWSYMSHIRYHLVLLNVNDSYDYLLPNRFYLGVSRIEENILHIQSYAYGKDTLNIRSFFVAV